MEDLLDRLRYRISLLGRDGYDTMAEQNAIEEIEELRASEERLTCLLGDALRHTPESYSEPIFKILRAKAAEAGGET
jgi:hypothetical protein